MKKSFILLSLLCLAAIAGTVFFWVSLNRDKVDVRLNESVVYGDPREADNLSFTLQAYLFDKVLWKTEHILGVENQEKMIQQLEQKLASYFHIPVDDEKLRVLIMTDDSGNITTEQDHTENAMQETIDSRCIVADQAIWFTFSNRYHVSKQKAKQYLSGLPKGAGVYRLPYQIKEGIPYFDADQLEQVYAIPADTSLGEYVVDQNAHCILIHTKKDGKQSITVLSSETGACVQEIPLESLSEDEEVWFEYKDGVVLISSDEYQMIVLGKTEGSYRISLDINVADEDEYLNYQDFAWNGDKLAMFTEDSKGLHYVCVYGTNGLLYKGKYWESLILLDEKKQNSEYSFVSYDIDTPVNLQWR